MDGGSLGMARWDLLVGGGVLELVVGVGKWTLRLMEFEESGGKRGLARC